jgi:hypothetical protein
MLSFPSQFALLPMELLDAVWNVATLAIATPAWPAQMEFASMMQPGALRADLVMLGSLSMDR